MVEKGCLYVVATPIGNLGDISARAIEVLSGVDAIACEDTRHSAKLLLHLGITTRTLAYHEHNERQLCHKLVARLQEGESLALVSDAGTPLVSDPGYHLVHSAQEAGCTVVPIPGPSALIAALSVSGLPSDRFCFEGFLPSKPSARRQRLQSFVDDPHTLIFYESTHRIKESISDMSAVFGDDRFVVIARELTKKFETVHGDTLAGLEAWLSADDNQLRGEFVVMVKGAEVQESSEVDPEAERILKCLLAELPVKQAAGLAAKITGLKKNSLYQHALSLS